MNKNFLNKMLFFVACTFSFIQISSMAPHNAASRLLAISKPNTSLQSQTRSYSSQIPVEQSNKALATVIKEEQKSKKSSWYKGKSKYPLAAGFGIGAALEMNDLTDAHAESFDEMVSNDPSLNLRKKFKLENIKQDMKTAFLYLGIDLENTPANLEIENADIKTIEEYFEIFKNISMYSKDAKKIDPEMYQLFLKIKKDLGITENINFRVGSPECILLQNNPAAYVHQCKTITIDYRLKQIPPIEKIRIIAHELEHVKQDHYYPDSYKTPTIKQFIDSIKNGDQSPSGAHLKLETGADASAAGYFDCPECLKFIKDNLSNDPILKYNPKDLLSGYFTTEKGYFAREDYEPYIQRAYLDGELCEGHSILTKLLKEIDTSVPYGFDSFWNKKQISNKYNRLYNQQVLSKPANLFLPKPTDRTNSKV